MKTIHLLLGNSDTRVSNMLEVMLRDLCYERALLNLLRASRIDEFTHKASSQDFALAIFAPDSLRPAPRQTLTSRAVLESVRQIRSIKSHGELPLIAIAVSPRDELPLVEAGVDSALGLPFNLEAVRASVETFLPLPPIVEETPEAGWSFNRLVRSLQRLTAL